MGSFFSCSERPHYRQTNDWQLIEISDECYETYPCKHYVKLQNKHTKIIYEYLMLSPDIRNWLNNGDTSNSIVVKNIEHFKF